MWCGNLVFSVLSFVDSMMCVQLLIGVVPLVAGDVGEVCRLQAGWWRGGANCY